MNNNYILENKLNSYVNPTGDRIERCTINVQKLSFIMLRDSIIGLGRICEEDLDNQVYVIQIKSGFLNMNSAIVVIELYESKVDMVGYSKEGVFNQRTAKKAINRIIENICKVEDLV